jgi:hypothetical protein
MWYCNYTWYDFYSYLRRDVTNTQLEVNDVWDGHAHDAPQSLLYELPLQMRATGVPLVGFKADLFLPEEFTVALSSAHISGLGEVAKGLTNLFFRLSRAPLSPDPFPSSELI